MLFCKISQYFASFYINTFINTINGTSPNPQFQYHIIMPKISTRGQILPSSPIRNLMPYARAAKKKGIHIHHLNIGQPDIQTPPQALEAIRKMDSKIVAYGPSEGQYSLRETVANYYQKFQIHIKPEDVFVTTGASEAILFALFSCFEQGDEIIIPEPFYANYIGFSQISDINIRAISTDISNGFQLPPVEEFEAMIGPKTRAIFLCNPGNPTGQLYDETALAKLAELILKHDLFLIVDEVYREFCYDGKFKSVLNFPELKNHVVVLDSISKVFSSCGARIGYLVTQNPELQKIVPKLAQMRLCPPALGQILAEACNSNVDQYLDPVKAKYDARRQKLHERLSTIPGVQCYMPRAAFYNMVGLPVEDAAHFCRWMLSDFSYRGETVMMAPGNGFYFNRELGKNQVRIAFVLGVEKLDRAMDCLEHALLSGSYAKVETTTSLSVDKLMP